MINLRSKNIIAVIALLTVALSSVFVLPSFAADDSNGNEETADSLTIYVNYAGDLPEVVKVFSVDEVKALGTADQMYTWITRIGRPVYHAVRGVKLRDIIIAAGIDINSIARIHFTCSDAHETEELTVGTLFNSKRYYYPNLVKAWDFDLNVAGEGAADGAVEVDAVLAVEEYWHKPLSSDDPPVTFEEIVPDKRFRLAYGMTDVVTPTSPNSAQYIHSIEFTLAGAPPKDEEKPKETPKTKKPKKPVAKDSEKKDKKKLIGSEKGQKDGADDTNRKGADAGSEKNGAGDGKAEGDGKGEEPKESAVAPTDQTPGLKFTLLEVDDSAGNELKKDGYQPWRTDNMSADAQTYIPGGGGDGMTGRTAGMIGGLLMLGGLWRFFLFRQL